MLQAEVSEGYQDDRITQLIVLDVHPIIKP